MGQVIQVNGDYNIKAKEGSTIKLDTGPGVGNVLITGDLRVEGDTVYVTAENLDVEDNIITVNKGETGAGVTLDYSGIMVDRGTLGSASLIWSENIIVPNGQTGEPGALDGGWQLAVGPEGTYSFANSRLLLRQIITDPLTDNGDLLLIGSGTGVIKVIGTDNYEDQVIAFGDDAIPNKKYVDDAIQNNPTFQILSNDSRVIVTDKETAGSLAYFISETGYSTFGDSAVSILVDNTLVAQYYTDRVLVGNPGVFGLEFDGTNYEIRTETSVSNQNIFIKTTGTGKLQTNYALQLEQKATPPSFVAGNSLVYAADVAVGDSGVWYVNDNAQVNKRNGELISKNKALIFSMLF